MRLADLVEYEDYSIAKVHLPPTVGTEVRCMVLPDLPVREGRRWIDPFFDDRPVHIPKEERMEWPLAEEWFRVEE